MAEEYYVSRKYHQMSLFAEELGEDHKQAVLAELEKTYGDLAAFAGDVFFDGCIYAPFALRRI